MLENFVVKVPYTTSPFMQRTDDAIFNIKPNANIINLKRQELEIWRDDLYGEVKDNTTVELLKKACELTNKPITTDIVEFSLQFEEDVALLHNGILQAACFCFPSGWIPGNRIGKSLSEIHSHVADGEKLVNASKRIAETMAAKDCFKRHVWTITQNKYLNQHPLIKNVNVPKSLSDLYFRTETQTTMPLGDGVSSLFFVKVDMYSLTKVFKNTELRDQIVSSVNSMSDAVLDYKNLRHIKKFLIDANLEVC